MSLDVTGLVVPGQTATIGYLAFRNGEPYTAAGAWIDLSSWLVVSR